MPKCRQHGLAFVELQELSGGEIDPFLGATIAGRFTVVGRLGRGSMGAVYRARQQAMGRDVALKIVRRERAYDPETKARFEREARAISQLSSPHTITAFDFGEAEDGSWFLAMEMLEGETVGERLRREGRIDWHDAVRFTIEALRSLGEAHGKGIIHRDLKPDNLFLTRLPEASGHARELCKVLDFGIAKWQGGDEARIDPLETQAGTVFGTPRYMSPEQAQGVPLDPRSDLYSLGVLLYQMLAGRAPFVDDDAVVVMARHIKDDPPPFPEVAAAAKIPPAVERVVRRTLEKSPDARPQTAEQLRDELERAVEFSTAAASGVQPSLPALSAEAGAPPRRRTAAFIGIAISVVLAIVALAGFALRSSEVRPAGATAASPELATPSALAPPMTTDPVDSRRFNASSNDTSSSENFSGAVESDVANLGAASSAPRKASTRPRPPARAPLPRKGNERYGRFE